MQLGKMEYKRYRLTDEQYQEIFEMFKKAKTNQEIADAFKLNKQQISAVLSQINSTLIAKRIRFHKIIEEQTPDKDLSSIRDMMFPCDNKPTVGTVVIKNGEIIHDGNNVTDEFRTLKHFY